MTTHDLGHDDDLRTAQRTYQGAVKKTDFAEKSFLLGCPAQPRKPHEVLRRVAIFRRAASQLSGPHPGLLGQRLHVAVNRLKGQATLLELAAQICLTSRAVQSRPRGEQTEEKLCSQAAATR